MAYIEQTEPHSAQAVMERAAQVRAFRDSFAPPGSWQAKVAELKCELENIKAERDQYRSLCVDLKSRNEILADTLKTQPASVLLAGVRRFTMTAKNIIKVVSNGYGVSVEAILGPERSAYIVEPRHVAMYLVKVLTRLSFPQVGKHFSGRDHTTALHAYQKIEMRRQMEPEFDEKIRWLMGLMVVSE